MKLDEILNTEYSTVTEQKKQIIVQTESPLNKIMNSFARWLLYLTPEFKLSSQHDWFEIEKEYRGLKKIFKKRFEKENKEIYTQKDITEFSLHMRTYNELEHYDHSGLFLSALIQAHRDFTKTNEPYLFLLSQEERNNKMKYIGYELSHIHLNIRGSIGDFLGMYMKSGKIIVEGSTKDFTGCNKSGGVIHLLENCGDDLGKKQDGGNIIVEGNAGKNVGGNFSAACGGSIILNGNYESISPFLRDYHSSIKIIHKGIQIFPRREE